MDVPYWDSLSFWASSITPTWFPGELNESTFETEAKDDLTKNILDGAAAEDDIEYDDFVCL